MTKPYLLYQFLLFLIPIYTIFAVNDKDRMHPDTKKIRQTFFLRLTFTIFAINKMNFKFNNIKNLC